MFWFIGWIPDSLLFYAVNILLIVGAVSAFLSFFIIHRIVRWFPALAPYHLLLQIISAVLLVTGIYFKGGYGVEMQWRERVADLQSQITASEDKAREANAQVVIEYRDRIRTVVETKVVIQEKIKEAETIVDAQCTLAPEAVSIHNDAAKLPEGNKK